MEFRSSSNSRRHERGSNWTDPEIVELLQLWSDESVQVELESSLRNQRVFDRIAHVLREKGIYRTGDQCREKIKKMKLEYRRIKDNHKMRSWKFYDVMDRVLANRPAVTYSSLGGTVIAQQVFHSAGTPEAFHLPNPSFGPSSSGGFLFGRPPKAEDPLEIKCEEEEEEVDESMLNSAAAPPEMYYGSGGEDPQTDGDPPLGPETCTRISPSGFSDLNIAGPLGQDPSERPFKEAPPPPPAAPLRQRKRRRGGKTSWAGGGGSDRSGGHQSLDKALASFLTWQRSAEERLLSLEEARLDGELRAEERREQREEKRAEQERQHELRLFSMLTGALFRQGDQSSPREPPTRSDPAPKATATSSLSTPPSPEIKRPQSASVVAEKMPEMIPESPYLSNRGNSIRQHQGILQEGFIRYGRNKYHHAENPDGIINMGTSENKLCWDLLQRRLTRADMLHVDPALLQYPDWRGHAFLREEVAKFLTHFCSSPRPLKAENVVVMNGCTSLFSCIAAVICDPKDAILIPTPFYGVITEDVRLYSDVKLFHVPLEAEADGKDERPFHLTVEKLEEGLKRAKQEGLIVRAVILMNPHNPLAEIYTPEDMAAFLEFAKRNELHAIVDEVYMLTVFDESATFHSVLSVDRLPDPQRTHVMWGMSKDFAMSGIRVGTLYTQNAELVEALAQLGGFHGLPGTIQHQMAQLLKDRDWIKEEFLPENRRRLKEAHGFVTGELRSLGIPYLKTPATLYLWADFRKYLTESSFEEEFSLWKLFLQHKVVVSCGRAFSCSTPGWFRIVFADQHGHLQLGLKRLREALEETERGCDPPPETADESEKSVTEDGARLDNGAIVSAATSPPGNGPSEAAKESQSPAEELVALDWKPDEGLDSLIGTLRHQIRSSDWLEKNTPELSAGEDPEILDVFKALLQRARK